MPEVLQQMLNYVIAIYIRLSAEDGDLSNEKSESNSVVNQRAYIRRFIELRPEFAGAQILEFCDDGYSGTNMERPAVRRLLEQVRQSAYGGGEWPLVRWPVATVRPEWPP